MPSAAMRRFPGNDEDNPFFTKCSATCPSRASASWSLGRTWHRPPRSQLHQLFKSPAPMASSGTPVARTPVQRSAGGIHERATETDLPGDGVE